MPDEQKSPDFSNLRVRVAPPADTTVIMYHPQTNEPTIIDKSVMKDYGSMGYSVIPKTQFEKDRPGTGELTPSGVASSTVDVIKNIPSSIVTAAKNFSTKPVSARISNPRQGGALENMAAGQVVHNVNQVLEEDAARKAAGYSPVYRGVAQIAGAAGISPTSMERHAARGESEAIAGEAAAPIVLQAIGHAAKAAPTMEEFANAVKATKNSEAGFISLGGKSTSGLRIREITPEGEPKPNYVYRSRDVGEKGIPYHPESHSQATASAEEAAQYAEHRGKVTGKPQEIIKVDMNKIDPEHHTTKEGPRGNDWTKFNREIGEHEVEPLEKKAAPDYKAAATKHGVEFRGIQEGIGKHPGLAIFQDPESKTSVAVKLDQWSPEKLKEHINAARERMKPAETNK